MPIYQSQGNLPAKRHTMFEKPNGGLYHEQLFGTVGFDGMSSLLYHLHPPTQVSQILKTIDVAPRIAENKNMTSRLLKGFEVQPEKDFLSSRISSSGQLRCPFGASSTSILSYRLFLQKTLMLMSCCLFIKEMECSARCWGILLLNLGTI